ncbi:MAG TPA: glycosyltransferase [Syntrophomonadaceae bacterium]|nr:glycosyltransferase [Syntrophomonadaceae bacterium]
MSASRASSLEKGGRGFNSRVLVVAHEFPFPPIGGGRIKTYHVLKALVPYHEVHLFALKENSDIDHNSCDLPLASTTIIPIRRHRQLLGYLSALFSPLPYGFKVISTKQVRHALAELIDRVNPDLIVVDSASMAHLLAGNSQAKVLTQADCFSLLEKRLARSSGFLPLKLHYWIYYLKALWYEKRIYPSYDACIVVSPIDAEALRVVIDGSVPIHYVPNGVDVNFFKPLEVPVQRQSLVFVGSMHYMPNVQAAISLVHDILPGVRQSYPDAKVFIVGRDPTPAVLALADIKGVVVTGAVEDVRPWIAQSEIAVIPLWAGTGIKNKVLEILAMGKPLVTTPIGAEGLAIVDGIHALIRRNPREITDAVISLLQSPDLQRRLCKEGREFAESQSWDRAEETYARVVAEVLSRRHPVPFRYV